MRWLAGPVIASLLLVACERGAPPAPAPQAAAAGVEQESVRLGEWLDARFEEQLDFSPLTKTRLGRKDDYDRIDELSESAAAERLEWRRQTVRDLEQSFDRARLTPEAQTSYDLWVFGLEQAEAAWPFRRRGYVFQQMDGPHTSLPQALINFHRVDDENDMLAYVARIEGVARAVEQLLERA